MLNDKFKISFYCQFEIMLLKATFHILKVLSIKDIRLFNINVQKPLIHRQISPTGLSPSLEWLRWMQYLDQSSNYFQKWKLNPEVEKKNFFLFNMEVKNVCPNDKYSLCWQLNIFTFEDTKKTASYT